MATALAIRPRVNAPSWRASPLAHEDPFLEFKVRGMMY